MDVRLFVAVLEDGTVVEADAPDELRACIMFAQLVHLVEDAFDPDWRNRRPDGASEGR